MSNVKGTNLPKLETAEKWLESGTFQLTALNTTPIHPAENTHVQYSELLLVQMPKTVNLSVEMATVQKTRWPGYNLIRKYESLYFQNKQMIHDVFMLCWYVGHQESLMSWYPPTV